MGTGVGWVVCELGYGRMTDPTNISNPPLISVIMAVYNGERFVADAIRSILSQSEGNFEFIIIDDGSTDGTSAILGEWAGRDDRIRLLHGVHGGSYHARNLGLSASRGIYIAHMDADDIALPGRFRAQLEMMNNTGVDVCGCCARSFNGRDNLWWFPEHHAAICNELVFSNALLHATLMLRGDLARAYPYDDTLLTMGDYELCTRLALSVRLGNLQQVLHLWRSHPEQTHSVLNDAAVKNMRLFRRVYVQARYPQVDGHESLLHLADRVAFVRLEDLEQAGEWLLRMADDSNAFLKDKMANRWFKACRQSASLGLGVYSLYRRILPGFGVAGKTGDVGLWLATLLKLPPGSSLARAYQDLKRLVHWRIK